MYLELCTVHNKLKPKAGSIPERIKYFPGANIEDRWVDVRPYPPYIAPYIAPAPSTDNAS